MSISNGQLADENSFNAAFVSKTTNDTKSEKLGLNSTDAADGQAVTSVQASLNKMAPYPVANQIISAGGTISVVDYKGMQRLKVSSNSGTETASTTPFGTDASTWSDGMELLLVGTSATEVLEIPYADVDYGCLLKGDMYLGLDDAIRLSWDASRLRFIDAGRNN